MDWHWRRLVRPVMWPARGGLKGWLLVLFSFLAVVILLELAVSFPLPELANGYVLVNGGAL